MQSQQLFITRCLILARGHVAGIRVHTYIVHYICLQLLLLVDVEARKTGPGHGWVLPRMNRQTLESWLMKQ
ncbi:hypothetical protein C8R43DRAFT_990288 [Mycena crocata]|nr:hypothetical protein C8R43DRAFT_990288 [Mycena crocata]